MQHEQDYYYEALPFAETHPDHLSALGTLFGLRPAPPASCRVLEIGTATGGNLFALAAALPDSSFLGIDRADESIVVARDTLLAARLGNAVVRLEDVRSFEEEPASFDYIICHGVYSWIPDDARAAIRKVLRRHLAPHGIAYLSFNTLPGWHLRGAIRDMLLREVPKDGTAEARVAKARAFLRFLATNIHDEDPTRAWLSSELALLERLPDHYLLGEHLATYNRPEYFSDFVRDMAEDGLAFVADAHVPLLFPDRLGEQATLAVKERGGDFVAVQQSLDDLELRYFRRALLCRDDAPLDRHVSADRLFSLVVASQLRPSADAPNLAEGAAEDFEGRGGAISTEKAWLKAALVLLSRCAPAGMPFLELSTLVAKELGRAAVTEDERRWLARNLLGLYTKGAIQLWGRARPATNEVRERPLANPWARFQARAGHKIATSAMHHVIETDSFDRALLSRMDGSRTVDELVAGALEDAEKGIVTVTMNEGLCADREVFTEIAAQKLARYARLGFLLS